MWQKAFRYFLAVSLLLAVSSAFFWPYLEGQRMTQADIAQYQGMSQEIRLYEEVTGRTPLWTDAMFGGMPTYQIKTPDKGNYLKYFSRVLMLNRENPIGIMFTAMVCMFVLLLILKVDFSIAILGAILFGLATNNVLLYEVGHISKLRSVSFLPLILGAMVLAFRGQYLWGFFCFAIGLGLNLLANHVQMTYYFFLTVPLYFLAKLYDPNKSARIDRFVGASLVLLLAFLLSLGTAVSNLWPTYEYAYESVRGKAIVTSQQAYAQGINAKQQEAGLSWDYAMEWSNGVLDLIACVIPGAVGSSSQARLFKESSLYQDLVLEGASENEIYRAPLYWGDLPYTDGPQYFGIVLFFFFVVGLLTVKCPLKWWAGLGLMLITLLSLGENFSFLNEFVFKYVPLYNKFRTPNSILSIAPILIITLAVITLSRLVQSPDRLHHWPVVKKVGVRFILFLIVLILMGPYVLDFQSPLDEQYAASGLNLENLRTDRLYLFKYDSTRALLLVVLALFLLWAFLHDRLGRRLFVLILAVLTFVDFWTIDRRFIDSASFKDQEDIQVPFEARSVDRQILTDSGHFRIFDLSVNTFSTASSSYYHKTLGGYHAAKLRRYQDIIDWYLARGDRGVVNMLNAKYIIQPGAEGNAEAMINEGALGNVWAVDSIILAEDNFQELALIDSIDPGNVAVVHRDFKSYLSGLNPDPSGRISLTNYAPDHLTYSTESSGEMLAVFSEIWYKPDKGWQAFIDDQPVNHIRANYILRAIKVPPGQHEIKFVFKPRSFYTGRIISKISSSFIFFGFIWLLGITLYGSFFRTAPVRLEKVGKAENRRERRSIGAVRLLRIDQRWSKILEKWEKVNLFSYLTGIRTFYGLSAIVLVSLMGLSLGSGVNADEEYQVDYSQKLVGFYTSFGADTSALYIEEGNMHLYGGLFDLLTGIISQQFGWDELNQSYHLFRHLMCSFFGFLAILFTALIGKKLGGWKAAILTMIFLFLSPRFIGHALMNPKDIPFAAGYIMSIYFLLRFFSEFPRPSLGSLLGISIGIGIALGTRAGGLLLILFLFACSILHFMIRKHNEEVNGRGIWNYLKYLIPVSLVGYILAIICWPAALLNPLFHPINALLRFSDLEVYIRLLFQGENVMSNEVVWYYLFVWIWKTTPIFVLVGIIGSLVTSKIFSRKSFSFEYAVLVIFGCLPLLLVIVQRSVLHDGWRHLTFVYPCLVVLAALFWQGFLMRFRNKKIYYAGSIILLVLMLFESGSFIWRNKQFPYVYFNSLSGGITEAYGEYETDYWGLSIKQAVDWMEGQEILHSNMSDTLTIATSYYYNVSWQLDQSYRNKVKIKYVRYLEKDLEDWDYGIFPSRFVPSTMIKSGEWPSQETLFTVEADGVPLTAVIRKSRAAAVFGTKLNDNIQSMKSETDEL